MIEKISEKTKQAILRKTPFAHSTRPSDDGMPASQVKKMFYTALVDEQDSLLSEMERMRLEANDELERKTDKAAIADRVEDHVDSHHYPSTLGLTRYVDKVGNVLRLFFGGLIVKSESWQQMSVPMGTYGYRATIALPNVTAAMIPELCFAPDDAVRSQLATFCRCIDGGVEIYSTEAIEHIVTVESLMCSVPTCFSLVVAAPHVLVSVADRAGKTYQSGDFTALGAELCISVTPESGYTLTHFTVNGVNHGADQEANVTVKGTVFVEANAAEVTP